MAAERDQHQRGPAAAGGGAAEPDHPGPFAVGRYAAGLRGFLRGRPRVRLLGEVTGLRVTPKGVYFELRDAEGALPCSIWRDVYDGLEIPDGLLRDGTEVVVSGGLDYYPGSATASPSFSFRATHLRLAGEGDLLAQLARLRRKLESEGLFEPQKRLAIPMLPRAIGVVTGRGSAAQADVLAGLERRSWRGTVIFAHPPVQDRHAAPRIARALSDLAARSEVEAIVVARGGGSLADLWGFCDETLCRTVALLRVPVIAAVGHESDRTLIDDVAAVSCSTPTHAAEAAVRLDVAGARTELGSAAGALRRAAERAVRGRGAALSTQVRALVHHMAAQRSRLHQLLREIRAASARALGGRRREAHRAGLVLARKRGAELREAGRKLSGVHRRATMLQRRGRDAGERPAAALEGLARTLAAHDPDRVLERGYAIVESDDERREVLSRAAAARRVGRFRVRFADDDLRAEVIDDG